MGHFAFLRIQYAFGRATRCVAPGHPRPWRRWSRHRQLAATIYYDPLLNVPASTAAVMLVIQNYLAQVNFAGLVYVAKTEGAI